MSGRRQALGRWGEQLAADYLINLGYTVLGRNVRTPHGEIDLIVQGTHDSGGTIVFVEVKARRSTLFGPPEESVNRRKQNHILASIAYYMQNNSHPGMDWRIDVIAIENYQSGEAPRLTHFENALTG